MRAITAVPPPAGNPTTRWSGRLAGCAQAHGPAPRSAGAASRCASAWRRVGMARPSCFLLRLLAGLLVRLLGDRALLLDRRRELLGRIDRGDEPAIDQHAILESRLADDLTDRGGGPVVCLRGA